MHWAHRVAGDFPDGQLYLNLRGFGPDEQVMGSEEAASRALDALGVPAERIPATLDARTALYRSELAARRVLVLLDNARDSAQVRPLLPGTPGCLVLVTSRNRLTGLVAADGARLVTIDLFTAAQARELLAGRLGARRLNAEPEAVDQIIGACAGLPLALAIVAARAAGQADLPLAELAGELRAQADRLDTLTTDDPITDVRAVFSWSYRTLTPAAARLFRLLGLHPGPDFSAPAAASLAGLAPRAVRPLLAELTRANLLLDPAHGRHTLHDLLRTYAAEQAHLIDTEEQRRVALRRLLDHYLQTAYAADRLLDPARGRIVLTAAAPGVSPEPLASEQEALDWLTAEHAVLLSAVDCAAGAFDTHTWQLAWTLFHFLDRGRWQQLVTTLRIATAAADRCADAPVRGRLRRYLGHGYLQLGRLDQARTHLEEALAISRAAGDVAGEASAHAGLGYVDERLGHHSEAIEHDRSALDLFRAAGSRVGEADALNSLGWLLALMGDHEQALVLCRQALALHRELANRYGEADTLDSLGYAHHHLGHQREAIDCYREALGLFRELGYRYYQADTLRHIGDAYRDTGDLLAAIEAWRAALDLLVQLGHADADQVRARLAGLDDPSGD